MYDGVQSGAHHHVIQCFQELFLARELCSTFASTQAILSEYSISFHVVGRRCSGYRLLYRDIYRKFLLGEDALGIFRALEVQASLVVSQAEVWLARPLVSMWMP